jgi:ATP-dependent DNA helicase RecG
VHLTNSDRLLEEIPNKVRDILGIMVDVNLKSEPHGNYLEIAVNPYPYPVSYKGQYHLRSGSTKQELKGAALDRFIMGKQGKQWDGVPVPHVIPRDLDSSALDIFRKKALHSKRLSTDVIKESNTFLLEKLHLFEGEYLIRASVLLFHPDPEKFVSGAFIKIGYFQDNANVLYHDEVHGNLFTQVDKTLDLLLTKYLKARITYDGVQRIEKFPVPEPALREALLNAIAHKDYSSAFPIQISVYSDKIMMWNPGFLPQGWTVEHLLQKHASQPFNPDIANTFFRSGMIEAWGRGIERIMEACRNSGNPLPELIYEKTGLWVHFPFSSVDITQETTQETTQEKIISLIKAKPGITQKELADAVGITRDGIKYQLNKLKSEKIIKRVGSTKAGHWELM